MRAIFAGIAFAAALAASPTVAQVIVDEQSGEVFVAPPSGVVVEEPDGSFSSNAASSGEEGLELIAPNEYGYVNEPDDDEIDNVPPPE
jgi:hypothetical protein